MSGFKIVDYEQAEELHTTEQFIYNEEDLRTALKIIIGRGHTHFDVFSPEGDILTVGIAGEYGFVQFTKKSGDPPYLCATREIEDKETLVNFNIGNTPTPISLTYCLLRTQIIDIIVYYFQHRDLTKEYVWEEV